jgi:hypothetical protein
MMGWFRVRYVPWLLIIAAWVAVFFDASFVSVFFSGGAITYMALELAGQIRKPLHRNYLIDWYGQDRDPASQALVRDACTDITPKRMSDLTRDK